MALSDPIADALTCIRNSARIGKERVDLKASYVVTEILKILKREKFIYDYRLIEDKKQGILRVYLRKPNERTRTITSLVRMSRPGLRRYAKRDEIPTVLNGLGVCVVSTPQGLLTGDEAKKRGVGGELLLKVW
jgi:small subunit ribosomal protein S8